MSILLQGFRGEKSVIKQHVCIYVYGFPGGARGKKSPPANAADARDMSSSPGVDGSHGVGKGNPSCITAWKILWTEKPAWLQYTGSNRVYMHIYVKYIYTYIYMSGQFLSLPWLLHNKNLKGLKQQTSYSSVQLKQTDLLLERHMAAGRPQRSHPPHSFWLPPLYTSLFSFWLRPVQNRACSHHQSMKGNANRHTSRPIDKCNLFNSRLCCVYLPIIQCYNQMYFCVECLQTLNGLLAA